MSAWESVTLNTQPIPSRLCVTLFRFSYFVASFNEFFGQIVSVFFYYPFLIKNMIIYGNTANAAPRDCKIEARHELIISKSLKKKLCQNGI